MSRLGKRDRCPIHNSFFCCGRSEILRPSSATSKWEKVAPGVYRIKDEHHPRGYRERRSKTAMRKLLMVKLKEHKGKCALCHQDIEDFRECVPDHREPRGMDAARRDDHPDNIQPAHAICNSEKGSKRFKELTQ